LSIIEHSSNQWDEVPL